MMLMNAGKSLMMNFDDKIKDIPQALANQMY
jgi:hypothetical protein